MMREFCRTRTGAILGLGNRVTVSRHILAAWGWQDYPMIDGKKDVRVSIPDGTTGVVVDVSKHHATCDCVVGDVLYRFTVEGQYLQIG